MNDLNIAELSRPGVALGASADLAAQRRAQLSELLPEAFSEGRLDVAALKRALGEANVIEGGERYALTWAGKSDAYRVLQTPTTATLRPRRDQSVNFDTAQHVFIEGENLEVLKVLQKAYFGKVKLIYIDPPYNTGSDSFIYPDRFQESKEDYLRRINDLADDGTLMREGFFRRNSKESGHFHSNWLSMMLPQLYIARNLLRDDGVIFVSCDDNEVHNLRLVMNEVFGEENFIANVVWQKRYVSNVTAKHLSDMHDHILVFARQTESFSVALVDRSAEQLADYKNPDNDPRGPWRAQDLSASKPYQAGIYTITTPAGLKVDPPPGRFWRCSRGQYDEWVADNRIWFGKEGTARPMLKAFLSEVQRGITPNTWWDHEFAGHNKEATLELKELFGGAAPFDTPKPVKLIQRILEIAGGDDGLVLDFFAGSATTAEAVFRLNAKDGGRRRVLAVQLPEPCEPDSVAAGMHFETIAAISRARIERVIEEITSQADLATPAAAGLGLRSFTLAPSNFKQWRGDGIDTAEQLAEQMALFTQTEKPGAQVEDMLYELLLKFGQELTTPVQALEVAGGRVFAVNGGAMLFVLEPLNAEMVMSLVALAPRELIAIEGAFQDSDTLKTNLDLQCRDAGIRFTCV
jgi:adenine-specific DNA-methyltransferase